MADQQDTLLREVSEELRREQLVKIWNSYGTYIVAAVAALLLSIGGYKWFEGRALVTAQRAGSDYAVAAKLARDGKSEEALKAFSELAKAGPQGYAALAQLRLAAAAAKDGKPDVALAAYERLAADSAIDPLFSSFARLQIAVLKLDSADWTESQNRLNDLIADGSVWRYSAREVLALAALKAGKLEEARKALEPLFGDRNAPPSITERARVLLDQIVAAERSAAPSGSAPEAAKEKSEPPAKK